VREERVLYVPSTVRPEAREGSPRGKADYEGRVR
jgi:hypothetical protein